MPVRFQKWITRQDLRNNPKVYYVFGDNVQRVGLGGQAKEMRGEPNAIGVVTKWAPGWDEADYFNDVNMGAWLALESDLIKIANHLAHINTIVFPSDGLGTGLSELPRRAPKMYKKLYDTIADHAAKEGLTLPWEKPKGD